MAQKLPRPIEDYLIGKYDNGVCCYLITKEAYNTWYNQDVSVKHLCIKNNEGLDLVQYPLSGKATGYKAYKLDKVPLDLMKLINKEAPVLYEQLFAPKLAGKSEPTPDDYYIATGNTSGAYYFYLRKSDTDQNNRAWKTGAPGCMVVNTGNPKKFPQLSSEIKQELQKLNPEKYKEWEDFYIKKYPNIQRLNVTGPQCGCGTCKDCLKRRPLPDPKDDYIVVDGSNGLSLVKRAGYKQDIVAHNYDFNSGWQFTKVDTRGMAEGNIGEVKDYLYWKTTAFNKVKYQFEQYYAELKQKKVAEKQYSNQGAIQRNTYQVGSDLDIDEKVMTEDWSTKVKSYQSLATQVHQNMQDSIGISKDRDVVRGKQAKFTMFEEAGPLPKSMKTRVIDTAQYMAGYDPYQADFETQGVISVWGRDLHGKLVNRLSELTYEDSWRDISNWLKTERRSITPEDYYKLLINDPNTAGIVITKPRRVGMSHFSQAVKEYHKAQELIKQFEQTGYLFTNNSQTLKINNYEIINVPRKTITITSGQKCTGNSVSSIRCAPAVTEKHIGNWSEPIRGKESSRSCKIG